MTSYLDKELAGLAGVVYETGTTAVTGDFAIIQCITASTFTTLTNALASGDALTGIALPAGTILRGKFTAFTLSSGVVAAYNSQPLR